MSYKVYFSPILLFITIFVGSGLYLAYSGAPNAFYQLSPITAILPAIMLGWILHKGSAQQKMHDFIEGVRNKNIITMVIIFLLAGAFAEITKSMGSVDSVINLALSIVPSRFLLVGLFLIAAFISTSIGTSMGTIAAIAPIAAGLGVDASISPSLAAATVVGGAMFGDNLSIISDTTIASVTSQNADTKQKLKLNAKIAIVASLITMTVLLYNTSGAGGGMDVQPYSLILVLPYVALIALAIIGIDVFTALIASIFFASIIAMSTKNGCDFIVLSQLINKGFMSMHEIMLLSLMIGGLSGLANKEFAKKITEDLSNWLSRKKSGQTMAQLAIAKLAFMFDILLANNTIAIIFSGEIAREIAKKYNIPPHYSAVWLDIFSSVVQGIIPYGAQVLLASAITGVSPLSIMPYVYYCYSLGIIATLHILVIPIKSSSSSR